MRHYLKRGTKVKEYTVVAKLGEGASCVAYSCVDSSDRNVILKEYYPLALKLDRNDSNSIVCDEKELERFNQGLERYKQSIERQIKFRSGMGGDNNIVNQIFDVSDQFAWNGTYYAVMTAYTGKNFSQIESMPLYDRIRVCKSIAQYAEKCHNAGFLCLDIKPDNIFVLPETPEFPMFFDFDSMVSKEEAQKGYNLSFSERWAAPEQLIPGEYSKISEATDIYALGELVFWCVFGRNSRDEEHRSYSQYPYKESSYNNELRNETRCILNEIFNHTIRSLYRQRYQSVCELLSQFELLLEDLYPKKTKLISIKPLCMSHFVGRVEEIKRLKAMLDEKQFSILWGLGGIGKSEIAKKYCTCSDKYDVVLFFTYGTDLVSTIVQTNFISSIDRMEKETDVDYCNRKLDKLSELCDQRTLIIIDNFNEEIENIECKDIFTRLVNMNCDLLLTTRNNQESYKEYQIQVGTMDASLLAEIFRSNQPFSSDQEEFVREIIERTQNHTLLVDLISRLAKNSFLSPQAMLEKLERNGIFQVSEENIKWNQTNNTIEEHVSQLFDMSDISDEQLILMFKFSLMPLSGIRAEFFCDFYKIENCSDLRSLIDSGWIKESHDTETILVMHSIVANVVISQVDQRGLVPNEFMSQLYERIHDYQPSESLKPEEVYPVFRTISDSISRLGINDLFAANYNTLFVHGCSDCFNLANLINAIQVSIRIYEKLYQNQYSYPREMAYFEYAKLLSAIDYEDGKVSQVVDEELEEKLDVKEHMMLAKENSSTLWEINWAIIAVGISEIKVGKFWRIFRKKVYSDGCNKCESGTLKNKYFQNDYPFLASKDYWPDLRVNPLFQFYKTMLPGLASTVNKRSVWYMKLIFRLSCWPMLKAENVFCKANRKTTVALLEFKAVKDLYSNRYGSAKEKLEKANQYLCKRRPISKNTHEINHILSNVYLLLKEYDNAELCIKRCLEIEKTIVYENRWCDFENMLISLYVEKGDILSAHDVYVNAIEGQYVPNTEMKILLLRYQLLSMENRFRDMNTIVHIPFLDKSFEENCSEVEHSIELERKNRILMKYKAYIFKARICELSARYAIMVNQDYNSICRKSRMAYKLAKRYLGKKHPHTIEYASFHKECIMRAKSQKKKYISAENSDK